MKPPFESVAQLVAYVQEHEAHFTFRPEAVLCSESVKDEATRKMTLYGNRDALLGTYAADRIIGVSVVYQDEPRADVVLFKPGGKFYTDESWRIPVGAIGPSDMRQSPDYRTIDGGAVLVPSQEPWGFPTLLGAMEATR